MLIYDDFSGDNRAVFAQVLEFLGLDDEQVEIEPVRTKPRARRRAACSPIALVNRVRRAKRSAANASDRWRER